MSPGLSAAHLSRPRTPSTVRTETETHHMKPKISSAFRGCSSSSEPSGPTGPTFHFLGVRQRRTLLKLVETQPGRDPHPPSPPRPQEILRTHQKLQQTPMEPLSPVHNCGEQEHSVPVRKDTSARVSGRLAGPRMRRPPLPRMKDVFDVWGEKEEAVRKKSAEG